eukprot:g28556.t1
MTDQNKGPPHGPTAGCYHSPHWAATSIPARGCWHLLRTYFGGWCPRLREGWREREKKGRRRKGMGGTDEFRLTHPSLPPYYRKVIGTVATQPQEGVNDFGRELEEWRTDKKKRKKRKESEGEDNLLLMGFQKINWLGAC